MKIAYLMEEPGREEAHFWERCREYYNRLRYKRKKAALPLTGRPLRYDAELEIVCYGIPGWVLGLPEEKALSLMRAAVAAQRFEEGTLWYESGLAQRFGLQQPEAEGGLILCLLREELGGRLPEALVIIEREAEDGAQRGSRPEQFTEVIGAVYENLNHLTVITRHPEAYAELAERVYEDSGLLLQCLESPAAGYPYGAGALVLDNRGKRKGKRGYFPKDAVWLDICAQLPKFLDTAVKNGYNNNS